MLGQEGKVSKELGHLYINTRRTCITVERSGGFGDHGRGSLHATTLRNHEVDEYLGWQLSYDNDESIKTSILKFETCYYYGECEVKKSPLPDIYRI